MNSAWLIPVMCVVLSAILAALLALWRDMRKENRRMDREARERQRRTDEVQQARHVENRERFTALETKIDPMFTWFNNGRSGRQGD